MRLSSAVRYKLNHFELTPEEYTELYKARLKEIEKAKKDRAVLRDVLSLARANKEEGRLTIITDDDVKALKLLHS